ncbi:MAG: hypothetical protein N4A59_13060 [Marinifilum sp.]|jgi:hypothetical protein|nr:hypothetical protein [Marinifilum sp.]
MKTKIVTIWILCLFLILGNNVLGQGNGELTKYNINHFGKTISKVSVKWSFNTIMGEPTVNGVFKWEADSNTEINHLKYNDFIILKCKSNTSNSYAWVKIDPTVPKAGYGYGYNATGSPDWHRLFSSFNSNGRAIDYWTESEAKAFWKSGFSVVDFKIIRRL